MKDWWRSLGTNTKQAIVIVPILLVAGIYAYFRWLYNPLEAEVEELKKKREEVWAQLKKTQDTAFWIEEVRERDKIIEKELEEAEKRLPKDKDMPGMIVKLTKMAQRHFANFILIRPEKPETGENYNIYPVQMTIEGRYHSLLSFLSEIGNLPKIVIVTDLDIEEREGEEIKYPTLANLTLNLYTFKE